ncbi:MAG: nuclear transport factor 2 family protein [Bacteroidetes bacterium]|nr:nuclear transport factor 2 family protein [Bacteroidota bacterium]
MKTTKILIVFLIWINFGISLGQNLSTTALEIVNKRMDLYNQHNFEDFIKLYADDVKIYTYPDKLLGTGTENITSIFKPKFASKSIQVKIVSQMNNGNHVINHEIVKENEIETKYISIYEIRNGLIASIRFVRDY